MTKITIGCAGWAYRDWIGPFYPRTLPRRDHLAFYAKFFDFTEVNATFYSLPSLETTRHWAGTTPDEFRFSVKAWRTITHERQTRNESVDGLVDQFLARLAPLEAKVATLLFQFPPRFDARESHVVRVRRILEAVPADLTPVVEFRHESWFAQEALATLRADFPVVVGTTYIDAVSPHYMSAQGRYYVRLVGDRHLTTFARLQRHQHEALRDLDAHLRALRTAPAIREIFVVLNNHFQGFAPGDANALKRQWHLPRREFTRQKTLMDFT